MNFMHLNRPWSKWDRAIVAALIFIAIDGPALILLYLAIP